MPRLIWSRRAVADLERLRAFLMPKDSEAARQAINTVRQGVRILQDHPQIGRPIEDMSPAFREWPMRFGAGGYVALYRFDDGGIVILALRHMKEAGFSAD